MLQPGTDLAFEVCVSEREQRVPHFLDGLFVYSVQAAGEGRVFVLRVVQHPVDGLVVVQEAQDRLDFVRVTERGPPLADLLLIIKDAVKLSQNQIAKFLVEPWLLERVFDLAEYCLDSLRRLLHLVFERLAKQVHPVGD